MVGAVAPNGENVAIVPHRGDRLAFTVVGSDEGSKDDILGITITSNDTSDGIRYYPLASGVPLVEQTIRGDELVTARLGSDAAPPAADPAPAGIRAFGSFLVKPAACAQCAICAGPKGLSCARECEDAWWLVENGGYVSVVKMTADRSVILLHDQLQDARIWVELRPLVAAYAAVMTVSLPPLRTIGPPSAWADHIARFARDAVSPGAVDLAVTVGGAVEAGIALVGDGLARAALLVDPDLTPLADGSTSQLLREPEAAEKLAAFFEAVDPHREELMNIGTMSEEGVDALVDATFAGDEDLPQPRRELLRQVMREQLTMMLPLDLATQHTASPERPDWITRLAPLAGKCTIATNLERGWNSQLDFEAVLRRRAPGVTIVGLTSSSSHILSHPPDEVAALVRDLLRGDA